MSVLTSSGAAVPTHERAVDRRALALVIVAAVSASSVLVGMVLPFLVGAPAGVSLAELASGGHDPKGLWPSGTVFAAPVVVAQLLALAVAPLGMIGVLLLGVAETVTTWRTSTTRRRIVIGLALALASATAAWFLSPYGAATIAWLAD